MALILTTFAKEAYKPLTYNIGHFEHGQPLHIFRYVCLQASEASTPAVERSPSPPSPSHASLAQSVPATSIGAHARTMSLIGKTTGNMGGGSGIEPAGGGRLTPAGVNVLSSPGRRRPSSAAGIGMKAFVDFNVHHSRGT